MFGTVLEKYIGISKCTGRQLAEISGLSEAAISRYRSGKQVPKKSSADIESICRALAEISKVNGIDGVDFKKVSEEMRSAAGGDNFNYRAFRTRLNLLFSVLSVNVAKLSKSLNYDSSYISRIRNGQRKPSKPEKFAAEIAEYTASRFNSDSEMKTVSQLIGKSASDIKSCSAYAAAITAWLSDESGDELPENPISKFLRKLSEFDLNQYIRAIHFDEIKVPSVPFSIPISKIYYGLENMKKGEIDFLKATAFSKSCEPVFMGSDMQMDDMAADMDFSKKYMFGLAVMLKKGLHLNVVHNLNRPFNELMLGLESWIPLYMTGQISPYYLNGVHNRVFCHFLNVSGAAALAGESISGHHKNGRYYLTKNREELQYYRQRSEFILKKALPLMEIYRKDSAETFRAFLAADSEKPGNRKNKLSVPPLYTMEPGYLEEFLRKRNIPKGEAEKILRCAKEKRLMAENIMLHSRIEDEIPVLTQEEFEKYPPSLSVSDIFYENDLLYSYDDYEEHIKQTENFARKNPNYSFTMTTQNEFRNIRIVIREGEWAMISKGNSPAIHFIIRHPILRNAIENLIFPVTSA